MVGGLRVAAASDGARRGVRTLTQLPALAELALQPSALALGTRTARIAAARAAPRMSVRRRARCSEARTPTWHTHCTAYNAIPYNAIPDHSNREAQSMDDARVGRGARSARMCRRTHVSANSDLWFSHFRIAISTIIPRVHARWHLSQPEQSAHLRHFLFHFLLLDVQRGAHGPPGILAEIHSA